MRILYVCHRFPYPPQRGGKIRPFNMIRHFSAQGHRVLVASIARNAQEADAARGIAAHCEDYLLETVGEGAAVARMVARLPTLEPSSLAYFLSPSLKRRIAARLAAERFDLVFVHCSSAAQYVRQVRGIPKILDFGDMDSQKWREYAGHRPFPLSLGYRLECAKLERTEARLAAEFDMATATTRAELASLERLAPHARADWFPNGVDSDLFSPGSEPYDRDLVAFVGRMDYFPNQQAVQGFCHEVLPLIRATHPRVRFEIIGADPPHDIRRLAELPGVHVTGSVPDVKPLVRRAALTVAPLRIARGTQNKILESLALGVPVVASREAAGGVDAVPGEHLLVARDARETAAAVLRLLGSTADRERFARAGRARMLSHHSWSASMRRLDAIVADTLARSGKLASRAA